MFKDVLEYDPDLAMTIVKEFEGFRGEAYLCPAGVWTIGYGHTAGVKKGDRITQRKAEEMLHDDLVKFQDDLASLVKVKVTQRQFVALMSFIYNFGLTKCRQYSLFKELNKGNYSAASEWFPKYCNPGTSYEKGLKARRLEEQRLFLLRC